MRLLDDISKAVIVVALFVAILAVYDGIRNRF